MATLIMQTSFAVMYDANPTHTFEDLPNHSPNLCCRLQGCVL